MSPLTGINKPAEQAWDPAAPCHMLTFEGKDETYGKPPQGSLTEQRAEKAMRHINEELTALLHIIRNIGMRYQDGTIAVSFGKLFQFYVPISNKIVGILLRARRWRLVGFPGEMLYQGQDDNVLICLLLAEDKIPSTRRFCYQNHNKTGDIKESANIITKPGCKPHHNI